MWSTWGASPWEGKSGAEVGIVNTKVARRARAGQTFPHMLTLKVAETWLVCTLCNGWVMLLVCMGKTHFGGIIWGEVVMMHAQKFPVSMYFLCIPAYFRKAVHCTKALHPLTCAVQ